MRVCSCAVCSTPDCIVRLCVCVCGCVCARVCVVFDGRINIAHISQVAIRLKSGSQLHRGVCVCVHKSRDIIVMCWIDFEEQSGQSPVMTDILGNQVLSKSVMTDNIDNYYFAISIILYVVWLYSKSTASFSNGLYLWRNLPIIKKIFF